MFQFKKMFKEMPNDLQIAFCTIIITIIFVLVPPLNSSVLRIVFGMLFVLFLPGYLLISALFPKKDDLSGVERIALSFGLSIAVVPLLGLILNYTPWGIRFVPILSILSAFSMLLLFISYHQRSKLPENDRFSIPVNDLVMAFRQEFSGPKTKGDTILTIILIVSIILAVSMVIFVIVTPKTGERFTEFYILDTNGKADNYPTNLSVGVPEELIVGIVNHEYDFVNYTLQVGLDRDILYLKDIGLFHNETWEQTISLTPYETGNNVKMEFLLFNEYNYTEPYRTLHLWVDVENHE